jgi:hypothetical protein
MKIPYITDQDKINFVREHIRRRINITGLSDTSACQKLSKVIGLSGPTILKALRGEFTWRTINKMIAAGWFTRQDYKTQNDSQQNDPQQDEHPQKDLKSDIRHTNDQRVQNEREKAAFKRGYEQGLKAAQVVSNSAINGAIKAAYDRGFDDGKRQGYAQGKSDGQNQYRSSASGQASGIDMNRLTSLFNLNVQRGAAQGEVVAARRAAGRTIAKWIKEKFGQDVQVDVS